MEKVFHLIGAAGGYGTRIYVNSEELSAQDLLRELSMWKGYDQIRYHESRADDVWYRFEVRAGAMTDQVVAGLLALGFRQSKQVEVIQFFENYHTL